MLFFNVNLIWFADYSARSPSVFKTPWMVVPPDWSAETTFFAGDWSKATKSAMSSFFDLIVAKKSKF